MRFKRLLLGLGLVVSTAACTALLGDFTVGGGAGGSDANADGASNTDGSTTDGATAPNDAAPDGPRFDGGFDAGPPIPDGGFLNLYSFGSTNTSPPGNMRVAYDFGGNLFILFAYSLNNLDVLGTTVNTVGSFDIGLIKIGPNGNKIWVRTFGSAAFEAPGGLAVDPSGDVYISGSTEGTTIDFGGTTAPLTRKSNRYLGWIVKVNGNTGVPTKAIGIDGPGAHQGATCQALSARLARVVALCNVYGPAEFPMLPNGAPTAVTPPGGPSGSTAFVVADLDFNLNARWVNAFGAEGADTGSGVAVASNGDTFVVGNLYSNASTNFTDVKSTVSLPFNGASQLAVAMRLAGANGTAIWARGFEGSAGNFVTFNGVGVDNGGRIVGVGSINGTVTFGNQKSATSAGQNDAMLVSFDGASGTVNDLKTYGNGSFDDAAAIAFDAFNSPSVVGQYRSPNFAIDNVTLPDPLGNATCGFMFRSAPDLKPFWVAGFTTGLAGTYLQGWSVASDVGTGRVAAAGVFKGVMNFGDNNPVRSDMDGGAYNVWVVERRP